MTIKSFIGGARAASLGSLLLPSLQAAHHRGFVYIYADGSAVRDGLESGAAGGLCFREIHQFKVHLYAQEDTVSTMLPLLYSFESIVRQIEFGNHTVMYKLRASILTHDAKYVLKLTAGFCALGFWYTKVEGCTP